MANPIKGIGELPKASGANLGGLSQTNLLGGSGQGLGAGALNTFGSDGFSPSKELSGSGQNNGFKNAMPSLNNDGLTAGMPQAQQMQMPSQSGGSGEGDMWAMVGMQLLGKLIDKLFGGGEEGEGGGKKGGACSGGSGG